MPCMHSLPTGPSQQQQKQPFSQNEVLLIANLISRYFLLHCLAEFPLVWGHITTVDKLSAQGCKRSFQLYVECNNSVHLYHLESKEG